MPSPNSKKAKPNWYPPWAPRFWSGMRMGDVFELLRENKFRIHPSAYAMTALVGGCSVFNSVCSAVQQAAYGKRINDTQPKGPPVFVIGHWRSGTTLLHELLSLDPRFAFPSNFDAFVPHHLLVSRYFFYPVVKLLMPGKRPMDNMALGADSPQEDDFALLAYGAPTPYRRIAFPNRPHRDHMLLDLGNANEEELLALKTTMLTFVKTLTLRYDSQLVLKSPPHTGRIAQLAEWFPGAKFIHISRHPYKIVPSTMRLWKVVDSLQAFQLRHYDDATIKNYIFECQDLMYSSYLSQRANLPQNQLVEMRFEDLVADPVRQLERAYDQLELDSFGSLQPKVEAYFHANKDHQTNPLELEEALRIEIDTHWREYMEQFGYAQ